MIKHLSVILVLASGMFACQPKDPSLMITQEINEGWQFAEDGKDDWLPAAVPGCVHTDLLANEKIEDPFYRLNERDLQWIDKLNWAYKTNIRVEKELMARDRVALDFKGLDTYADIFLNGKQVASTDNMFREYLVDVKSFLQEGENELKIVFRSPIVEGLKKYDANPFVIPVSDNDLAEIGQVEGGKKVSVYTRKAGYHFGWDWGPRLVTSGIWRPVYLKAWDDARINNLQIVQHEVNEQKATFTAVIEVESEKSGPAIIQLENDGQVLATAQVKLQAGSATYPVDFQIADPKLWWTNGLGEQPLYTIKASLRIDGRTTEATGRIGIRTLELVREKDEQGTSFYFKLNGVPVFMKGANYIPNDAFPSRVSDDMYQTVVNTAKTSNMNMLRIWGGGIYEDDLFYDLCDEAGILVWQDFMFACAMFPGDDEFLSNVKEEAADNIRRLRNHPSIGLWCGNNEILAAWYSWGWKQAEEAKSQENADKIWKAYEDIFHNVLAEAVEEHDPARAYWSSSPSSGTGIPADLVNGDEHYWGVWWGKEPFKNYATHIARFMSEYGFQSFPELKTVKQYALPEDFDIVSEVMNSHQRSSIGNKTIEYYMLQDYKKPKDFESFLYVNHVLQAEGIKFAVEGHRRAMPYCMGSLYWQINDCWPVASWSSTDYYQRWKALQYYVKKGFEPILVSPYTEGDFLKIGIVSDRLQRINATLKLSMVDFSGKVVWENAVLAEIPANSSASYYDVNLVEFLEGKDSRNQLLVAEVVENGQVIAKNLFYFRPVKELNLPKPEVDYTIAAVDGGFEISLQSDKLAKNLFITIGDEEGFFSDNYFDLLPGEPVKIKLQTAIPKEKLDEVLAIQTLDGAF
ncbi:beta-mannosidase [Gaoshiqia sediminis]|uniref:Beta-mannosidase n=1 Tax=Gaoshiqia sediminis TaxID=2986998 RepID=A0AA41Y4Q7_9BACT|nr:glycoside hydrolase family 2 protein [Gaoshiqia sediminis]MCW0481481.1 glycoside hydrolase family 2 protein [Gaoshiqia sediminis]